MMKNKFEKFHEEEAVFLKSANLKNLKELRECLYRRGFKEMDDFFFLERNDVVHDWQATDIAHLTVINDFSDKQLDLIEDEPWNIMKIDYLFASLPFDFVNRFLDIVYGIAKELKLIVVHNHIECSEEKMIMAFYEYREDVRYSLDGEPGSEIVGINIAMTYPRN